MFEWYKKQRLNEQVKFNAMPVYTNTNTNPEMRSAIQAINQGQRLANLQIKTGTNTAELAMRNVMDIFGTGTIQLNAAINQANAIERAGIIDRNAMVDAYKQRDALLARGY